MNSNCKGDLGKIEGAAERFFFRRQKKVNVVPMCRGMMGVSENVSRCSGKNRKNIQTAVSKIGKCGGGPREYLGQVEIPV